MTALKVEISGPTGSGKTQLGHAIASLLRNNGIPVSLHDDGGVKTIERTTDLKVFPKATQVSVEVKS